MEGASSNDSGRSSVTDNHSGAAIGLSTKMARQLHRATLGTWCAMLLTAAGAQVLVLSPVQAASAKREITDRGITAAVEGGLVFEKGVFPSNVDVSTSQGIVTLSGSVNNLLAKERAVKMAESIRGVRGVIDRTTVGSGGVKPTRTRAEVVLAEW